MTSLSHEKLRYSDPRNQEPLDLHSWNVEKIDYVHEVTQPVKFNRNSSDIRAARPTRHKSAYIERCLPLCHAIVHCRLHHTLYDVVPCTLRRAFSGSQRLSNTLWSLYPLKLTISAHIDGTSINPYTLTRKRAKLHIKIYYGVLVANPKRPTVTAATPVCNVRLQQTGYVRSTDDVMCHQWHHQRPQIHSAIILTGKRRR